MSKIFKYELEITGYQQVKMPPLPRILKAVMQGNTLCVWAIVDSSLEDTETVDFWIVGTGNPMPEMKCDAMYIDSVLDGSFVWHVFGGPCYD